MNIQLSNVTLAYEHHPAIHHVTATIEHGDLLAVVGPNGAGKTTLLNVLAGLVPVSEGVIQGVRPEDIAYLPQQANIDRTFPLTVSELVMTGLWREVGFAKPIQRAQIQRCSEAIAAVGLQGFENRLIHTLSGGQMQRALFARVLLQNQSVILLDEPFNAIDPKAVSDLTQVIKNWHQARHTVVMVTHDLEYVRQHCPRTLLMARECIDHGLTEQVLTVENLRRARHMCEAFDENAPWCHQKVA